MAQSLAIRLAVVNGQAVKSELKGVGDAGDKSLGAVERAARKASTEMQDMSASSVRARSALDQLVTVAKIYAGIRVVQNVLDIGDAYTSMRDRIVLATGSIAEASVAQRKLFEIAQETRKPFADVADLYAKMAPALKDQNLSLDDQLTLIRLVGQALAINKTGVQESGDVLRQFGQLAGGAKVQAEELNSIMDGAPVIARAMAKGLLGPEGTVPGLKALAEAGLAVTPALQGLLSQAGDIDAQFRSIGRTSQDAWTQVINDFNKAAGEAINTSGAMDTVKGAIDGIREIITSPAFASGIAAFVSLFTNAATEIAKFVSDVGVAANQLQRSGSIIGAIKDSFRLTGGGLIGGVNDLSDYLDRLDLTIVGTTRSLRDAKAEMSAFFQSATKVQTPPNFAGGSGDFRAAQDVGMSEVGAKNYPAPEPMTPPPPKKTPGQIAAESALKKAQETYAKDEKVVSDIIRDMTKAANERDAAINAQVEKLSLDASPELIAQTKELTGALYDQAQARDRLEQKTKANVALDFEAIKLNKENATAADQFAASMRRLDDLRSHGLDQRAYTEEARKASDEAAKASEEGFKRQENSAQQTYEAMAQFANTAFGGISAGLANMLVEGEADFETFIKGMVKQIVASGIQQSLSMIFSAIAGPAIAGPAAAPGASFGNGGLGGGAFFGFHGGGTTDEPTFARFVPAEAFDHAPRFHSGRAGIAPNEIAAILRRDESVLTPGQMKQLAPAANQNTEVNVENRIEIINNTNAQVTAQQKPGGGMRVAIDQAVAGVISTPGSTAYRAVQQMVKQHGGR